MVTTDVSSKMDEEAYIPTSIMPLPAVDIDHFCAPVVHPVTEETITKYKTLVNDPATRERYVVGHLEKNLEIWHKKMISQAQQALTQYLCSHETK